MDPAEIKQQIEQILENRATLDSFQSVSTWASVISTFYLTLLSYDVEPYAAVPLTIEYMRSVASRHSSRSDHSED